MNSSEIRDEVVGLAQALIRIDTSNPPGRETPAAQLLADHLTAAGAECELVGPDPERLNLVARVRGRDGAPSLLLMAHTDVVPAPSDGWTVGPFDAELRDGHLTGRGAGDMKGELAARAVALAALARSGEPPAGDVVLVAESDEEKNTSDVGMSWLVRERPDVRCDYAINEGGGLLLNLACGRQVVTVAVGEKKVCSVRIRVRGKAGHASVPAASDNPLRHTATRDPALLATKAPSRPAPEVAATLRALGAPSATEEEVLFWGAAQHPVLADLLPTLTRMTVTPTGTHTYEPSNVIPPYADIVCDVRAMPDETEADIRAHIDDALGAEFTYEVELLEALEGGTASPIDTPLYRACEEFAGDRLNGAALFPYVTPGFTDSHWVRQTGTKAYGFAPVFVTNPDTYLDGMHGANECVRVDDLVTMTEFNLHAVRSLGAAGPA